MSLDLFLDPLLPFKYPIAKVVSKIAKGMFIIRSVKNILPKSALKTLYFSLINSHLIYALLCFCLFVIVLKSFMLSLLLSLRSCTNVSYYSRWPSRTSCVLFLTNHVCVSEIFAPCRTDSILWCTLSRTRIFPPVQFPFLSS